ncbi:MAG: hypothetical protein ACREP1_01005 [Rhodanobacteraceae bacterium]
MKTVLRLLRRLLPTVGLLGGLGGVAALPATASAGPAENIYTPIVDYREWELELKGGVQDWGNRDAGERAAKLAFGYGIAPRWGVEIEAEYSQTPGNVAHVEELEFENLIQLTEHGEHWMDAGIFAEFDHNRLENRNTLEIGPMLQREAGRSQFNLNVLWERRLSAAPAEGEDDEGNARNGLAYNAQWKYNLHPRFQPGVQVFATLGDPAHLHSDEFKAGPAFFGVARLGDGKSLRYNAALLGGMTRNTPDATFRFQLEYEFF